MIDITRKKQLEVKYKYKGHCEGCTEVMAFYDPPVCRSNLKPSVTIDGKEIKCPCGICLVKCTCQKACSDMKNYYDLLYLTFKEKGREEIFKQFEEI